MSYRTCDVGSAYPLGPCARLVRASCRELTYLALLTAALGTLWAAAVCASTPTPPLFGSSAEAEALRARAVAAELGDPPVAVPADGDDTGDGGTVADAGPAPAMTCAAH